MQSQSAAGFYGKLPCKGDFLQQRVAQEFVDAWDAWLQKCLVASREQLQERWLDAYLTSPVWRFALADGVCGSGAYAGVMLPSVDRVGRYFPLTLVTQLHTEDCLLEVAGAGGRQWFDSAEALALGALQAHDLDLAAFDEQVIALGAPTGEPQLAELAHLRELMQDGRFAQRPAQWQVPLSSVNALQGAANVFASRELERTLRPLALWWTDGSDLVAPCWLSSRGLPSAASFAALLAGHWQDCGWESLGEPNSALPIPARVAEPATDPYDLDSQASPAPATLQVAGAPVEIAERRSTIVRRPGSEPRVFFVSRPEQGLWAVCCAPADGSPGMAAAQAMADALHDIAAPGSLASLAEDVRRRLETVRTRMMVARISADKAAAPGDVGGVVLLVRADECAIVYLGAAHAVRVRSGMLTLIEGSAQTPPADGDVLQSLQRSGDGSLLDLLTPRPVTGTEPVSVHYDTLSVGDEWLLSGARLFEAAQLATLPSVLLQHHSGDEAVLTAIQRLVSLDSQFAEDELPLMLLTAVAR